MSFHAGTDNVPKRTVPSVTNVTSPTSVRRSSTACRITGSRPNRPESTSSSWSTSRSIELSRAAPRTVR
ncbi:hypothetical protein DEJ03_16510 [Curtobacterium sp. MCLR17_043]|nr:hypothetical protein DEJ03_16510 [Curtobacterium sp. MCLR17_043]